MKFYGHNQVTRAIANKEIPQLLKVNTRSREAQNDIITYTWVTAFGDTAKKMRDKGDFSYIKKGLFKKVYQGEEPFMLSFTAKDGNIISDYVYKAINAWGDSHAVDGIYFSANEFYDVARPSVIDNGYIKVEKELDDSSVVVVFDKTARATESKEGTSEIPKCI
jgi:hypothetical protein